MLDAPAAAAQPSPPASPDITPISDKKAEESVGKLAAETSETEPPATVDASQFATVVIYRGGGMNENLRRTPAVYCDQTLLGVGLARNRYLEVKVIPGEHRFFCQGNKELTIPIKAGETYYIRASQHFAHAGLQIKPNDEGAQDIKDKKPEEPSNVGATIVDKLPH
jgi:hypothetical protein